MAIDSDLLIDRRRLKRHLTLWRLLAILAAVALVGVALGRSGAFESGRHVAVLWIKGLIVADPWREKALYDLADDRSAAALIVRIDSPGGTTTASESLYRALRAVGEEKPVIAVMEGVAASGGYMAALAADRVIARNSTITGSIGVILEATNLVGLMEMLGIENEAIRSGPLKAQPNPLERLTPEAREMTQRLIDDVHGMFLKMVAERRGLDPTTVAGLADGRVFSGAMAQANGLIDALGGSREAREWLAETYGIGADLPEREVEIARPDQWLTRLVSRLFGKSYLSERLRLDGLVSVWHPLEIITD